MPRYVDAEKELAEMKFAWYPQDMDMTNAIRMYENFLKNAPSEDVAPVIHGHWIYQGLSPYNCFSRCSCCDVVFNGYETLEYCPKCGAKMDEVVG